MTTTTTTTPVVPATTLHVDNVKAVHNVLDRLARTTTPESRVDLVADAASVSGDKSALWSERHGLMASLLAAEFAGVYGTSAKVRRDHALIDLFEGTGYPRKTGQDWSTATGKMVEVHGFTPDALAKLHGPSCACQFAAGDAPVHVAHGVVARGTIGCMTVLGAYQLIAKTVRDAAKVDPPAEDGPAEDEPTTEDGPESGDGTTTATAERLLISAREAIIRAGKLIEQGDDTARVGDIRALLDTIARTFPGMEAHHTR